MPWAADSILIYNLVYTHEGQTFKMPPISAIIDPCQVVALVGKGSAGKTTVLRILAQHLIPNTGFTAFPSRWRVRLLDAANPPFFFRGTLIENMRFGELGRTIHPTPPPLHHPTTPPPHHPTTPPPHHAT